MLLYNINNKNKNVSIAIFHIFLIKNLHVVRGFCIQDMNSFVSIFLYFFEIM